MQPEAGQNACFRAAGCSGSTERKMKIMKRTTAIAALAVIALAAAGCSSSSSSSPSSGSTASGGGGTGDFYSSLPMQGASTSQTNPLVNGIKLSLAQAGGKAGPAAVDY